MDFIERDLEINKNGKRIITPDIVVPKKSLLLEDFETAQEYIDHHGIDDPEIIAAILERQ